MSADSRRVALYAELNQLVTELSLISHVSGVDYAGKGAKATDENIGGKRPPGGDVDKPQRPRNNDPKAMAAYHEEMESWRTSYQRFTPSYFKAEVLAAESVLDLEVLRDRAKMALAAWKRTPIPAGGEPASMADPQWKRWVIEGNWTATQIVNRYGCSRQYVYQLRNTDRHIEPPKKTEY